MGGDEARRCDHCDQPLYEGSSALKRFLSHNKRDWIVLLGLLPLSGIMSYVIEETGLVLLWLPFGVFASLILIVVFHIWCKLPADKGAKKKIAPDNVDSDPYKRCHLCGQPIDSEFITSANYIKARKLDVAARLLGVPMLLLSLIIRSITGTSVLWLVFQMLSLPLIIISYYKWRKK